MINDYSFTLKIVTSDHLTKLMKSNWVKGANSNNNRIKSNVRVLSVLNIIIIFINLQFLKL